MADASTHPLLSLVRDQSLLDDLQLDDVIQENTKTGKPVWQIIVDTGLINLDMLLQLIATQIGTEVVEIEESQLTPEVLETIPGDTARMFQCIPVAVYGASVQVAFADPLNTENIDQVSFVTGKEIIPVVADPTKIEKLINKFYASTDAGATMGDILKELGDDGDLKEIAAIGADLPDLTQMADATPIVKFVNLVLFQAVQDRAI